MLCFAFTTFFGVHGFWVKDGALEGTYEETAGRFGMVTSAIEGWDILVFLLYLFLSASLIDFRCLLLFHLFFVSSGKASNDFALGA